MIVIMIITTTIKIETVQSKELFLSLKVYQIDAFNFKKCHFFSSRVMFPFQVNKPKIMSPGHF